MTGGWLVAARAAGGISPLSNIAIVHVIQSTSGGYIKLRLDMQDPYKQPPHLDTTRQHKKVIL